MYRSCIEHTSIDGHPAVIFDTGMEPRNFAKTRGAELLTQQGLEIRWPQGQGVWKTIGEKESSPEGITPPSSVPVEMHPWLPEGSQEIDGHLWIWGREVPGLPLEEYIFQGGATALAAFVSYSRALHHIETVCPDRLKEITLLPPLVLVVPGEGVFFPPKALGERALRCGVYQRRAEEIIEQYQHPDLTGSAGLPFTVAVLAYRLWAGTFPFRFTLTPETPPIPKKGPSSSSTLDTREKPLTPGQVGISGREVSQGRPTQNSSPGIQRTSEGVLSPEWTPPQIEHAIHQIRADIRDGLFEPIHLAVPGIDRDLAQWIQRALTSPSIANAPQRKKNTLKHPRERLETTPGISRFSKSETEKGGLPEIKGTSLSGQDQGTTPSLEHLLEILEQFAYQEPAAFITPLTDTEKETLYKEKERYLRFQQRRIGGHRFFRKNRGVLIGGVLSIVVLALFIGSFIRDQAQRPTTKGMNPGEVLTTYYRAFNTLDHERMSACVEGKVGKEDITAVLNFYVISKVREAYEHKVLVLSPETWIEQGKPQGEFHVFGISDFSIEELQIRGNEASGRVTYRFWYPERQEEPSFVEERPSSSTEEPAGQHTHASSPLPPSRLEPSWVRREDKVVLTYKNDRWNITRIDRQVLEIGSPESR